MEHFCLISFLVLCVMLFYVAAGYPLLLGLLASRFEKPVKPGTVRKSISVLVPVHNGAPFLAAKLTSILGLDYPRELMQICVISDGSTDGTDEIALEFASRGIELLRVPRGGKPAALNAGIARSRGEILVLTDVRQALEPHSVSRLIDCFADPTVGVVSGDLVIRASADKEESSVGLYWRYERWIRKQLSRLDSMLGATGPFYAMRRELAVPIPPDTLLDDVYLPLAAYFRGFRLIVEERARAFDYPTSLRTEFTRKVRTLAGNYQLMRQYPALFSFRNRMLFHYLSYKVGRLTLPWIVLLLLVVSFGLPQPWFIVTLSAQGVFYALALLDLWIGPRSPLKRFSSPAGTVAGLLAATACAVVIFFRQPRELWKPTRVRLP